MKILYNSDVVKSSCAPDTVLPFISMDPRKHPLYSWMNVRQLVLSDAQLASLFLLICLDTAVPPRLILLIQPKPSL